MSTSEASVSRSPLPTASAASRSKLPAKTPSLRKSAFSSSSRSAWLQSIVAHRVRCRSGADRVLLLDRQVEPCPAGREHPHVGTRSEQLGDNRGRRGQLFEVVEHEQQSPGAELLPQLSGRTDGAGDRRLDKSLVGDRREGHEPHAVRPVADRRERSLESQPRLARPAGARERDQASVRAEERQDLGQLVGASDEARRRAHEVRVRDGQERRKSAASELEQAHRLVEVLQRVLAEIGSRRVDEAARGLAQQHLPAVACGHDPCGQVHVEPDVLRRLGYRLAGVDPHPYRERLAAGPLRSCQGLLGLRRCGDGRGRLFERHEEGVALVIHLVAPVALEGLTQQAPVQAERVRVALPA